MDDRNEKIVNYINNLKELLEKVGSEVSDELVKEVTSQCLNSSKSFEEIKVELDVLVKNKLSQLEKRKEQLEKISHEKLYNLNDLFNCRLSNNTLHIHVVPESVQGDIKASGGMKNYLTIVENKLDDALKKIVAILQEPNNQDINNVMAVSPTLKLSALQDMFAKKGFDVGFTKEEYFINMFNTNKIGIAIMPKNKFMELYAQKTESHGFGQEFNYHTHTYRSGHSEYVSDEEILEAAKRAGITMLGFSEHIPNPDLILPDEDHRMLLSEVEEYISSINKLKQEHPEMTILTGFEAEYDPMKEAYLGEMRDKVDYMVLGQHFVNRGLETTTPEDNPNYPIEYANMVIKALDSGIFDIVAHPDYFMKFRDTMTDDNKSLFEENAIIASQVICEKARDMGIPIEINLSQDRTLSDGRLTYPHPTFWKVASEIEGLKLLKGIDAHKISSFEKTKEANKQLVDIEQMIGDKLIRENYNPVIARNNNIKLKEAYKNGQNNALTFETHMITNIVDASLSSVGDSDSESITVTIGNSLNKTIENCSLSAKEKEKSTAKDLSDIAESKELSMVEIKGKLDRKKKTIEETKIVLSNQQRALNSAKNNVLNAMNIGCHNKDEYSNIITQITQHNTTNNETQKVQIEEHINSFQQSKLGGNTHGQSEGQSKALVRTNPNIPKKNSNDSQNNFNSNGFINIFILLLILLLITGLGIGIGYFIYKIKTGG